MRSAVEIKLIGQIKKDIKMFSLNSKKVIKMLF